MSQHESPYKNPYDFVPLEGESATRFPGAVWQARAQDRWNPHLRSGLIEARLITETPLFIHGAGQQQASRRAFFCDAHGEPLIPATSLKGPLRAIAEVASNGCLSVLSNGYERRGGLTQQELPSGYQPCTEADNACVACLLFGMTEEETGDEEEKPTPLAGRVYLADARPVDEVETVEVRIPEPRGGPKPHHRAFYFDHQGRILGRKFYYHHADYQASIDLYFAAPRPPRAVTLETVTGTFAFTVRFHNLTDDELDLLVYSLALEDRLRHHLGFAKAYGLGSTQIRIQHLWLDRYEDGLPARYLAYNPAPEEVRVEEDWRSRRDRIPQRWQQRPGGDTSYAAFTHILRWPARELYQYPTYIWFRNQRRTSRQVTLAQYQQGERRAPAADQVSPTGPPTGARTHRGRVKWFSDDKGYGFITQPDGTDIFVHFSGIVGEGRRSLQAGQQVAFNVRQTQRGPQAVDVIVVAGEGSHE